MKEFSHIEPLSPLCIHSYSETAGEVSEQSVDPLATLATSNDKMHPDGNM